jgi:N6-L-threonylcarbamoyladenine synthase
MKAYLGIDTSCYTTSLALVDAKGSVVADERMMLEVKQGSRGLRQSEGVFQHIKNLGTLFEKIKTLTGEYSIGAICASSKPRPAEGSYMPVFTVGENTGRVAASIANIPYFNTTHQENHLMAGIWSAGGPDSEHFLAFHLSGGTTEFLEVKGRETGFDIEIIGGTTDISAGQFIDRVGVAMGLPFPSGMYLEKMAEGVEGLPPRQRLSFWVEGLKVSYSGPETQARRMLEMGADKNVLALSVLDCIARSLEEVIRRACQSTGAGEVLMVGGVSSNRYIKHYLTWRLGCRLYFPEPAFCRDNAVGSAVLGMRMLKAGKC